MRSLPELPDVETFRRRLEKEGKGKTIEQVSVGSDRILESTPATLRDHLKGHRLLDTRRHGKWMFARVDGRGEEEWLAVHFGMTGDLVPYSTDKQPRPKHAVLELILRGGPAIAFTSQRHLGKLGLTKDPERFIKEHHLGPDAKDLDDKEFMTRLHKKKSAVKSALMDQSLMSGVGNVYADEALHHARIDPRKKADRLEKKELKRLHTKLQYVLERAIQAGAQPEKMPQSWLVPLRRERSPACPRCGEPLRHDKVGGRTTLWCPREAQ